MADHALTEFTETKKLPASALTFAADVAVEDAPADADIVPVRLTARSGLPVDHFYWGQVVHDMAGMVVPKPVIPLDYCHLQTEPVGYADQFDTSNGDLVISGALVPYPNDEDDRAAQIVHKSRRKVPYQASIYFDGPLIAEQVDRGASVTVNGRTLEGPALVFRQWTLRGVAICLYGMDPNTQTDVDAEMAAGPQLSVQFTTRKELSMPEGTTADATKTEPAKIETPPTDAKPSETPTETPTEKPVEKPADGGGDKSAPKDGKAFIADFGVDGAVWFAEGKSHAEAAQLFAKKLRDDNDALKKQVTEFTAKLGKSSGEADPLSFTEHTANKKTDKAAVNIGSPGVATFAAHLDEKNFAPKQPG